MDDDAPVPPEAGADPGEQPAGERPAGERPAAERPTAEQDFLIKQSIVGELEEFFPPEFLDKVKDRFEARLAERARAAGTPDGSGPGRPADSE